MKFEDNAKVGFGDTLLHRLRPEVKIIVALILIAASGMGNGRSLAIVGLLSLLGVFIARVPFKQILNITRRMAWFFFAIAVFPVLFTPGFYIDLPTWFPISISREGLFLGIESSVRLINILLVSFVLMRTTSSSDGMNGLEKLLGPLAQRLPVIRDLFEVTLLSVKFLPILFSEAQERFADLRKNEDESGIKKLPSVVHSVLQFIVEIFSDLDRFTTKTMNNDQGVDSKGLSNSAEMTSS